MFVEDRLVRREAIHTHTNAQPKSVFSNAMTVMDKFEEWEDEEEQEEEGRRRKRMGKFKIRSMHVNLH